LKTESNKIKKDYRSIHITDQDLCHANSTLKPAQFEGDGMNLQKAITV
jgi:hypothetical protein